MPPAIVRHRVLRKSCTGWFSTTPAPVGEVHPELRQRLPVTNADQLAGAGLRARVGATDGQLRDALIEQ